MKTKSLFLSLTLLIVSLAARSQNWEYVNLWHYKVSDTDLFQRYVKHALPYFEKSNRVPVVRRAGAIGETGNVYIAVYLASYEHFTQYVRDRAIDFEQYTKSPGSLWNEMGAALESGRYEVLWKLNKVLSTIPEGYDPAKNPWRKLHFVSVKPGKMPEYVATWLRIKEIHKTLGINYPIFAFNVAYGAPDNTVLISVPAESALAYYTAAANRNKIRQGNPEVIQLFRKLQSLTSNTIIDQITVIPH